MSDSNKTTNTSIHGTDNLILREHGRNKIVDGISVIGDENITNGSDVYIHGNGNNAAKGDKVNLFGSKNTVYGSGMISGTSNYIFEPNTRNDNTDKFNKIHGTQNVLMNNNNINSIFGTNNKAMGPSIYISECSTDEGWYIELTDNMFESLDMFISLDQDLPLFFLSGRPRDGLTEELVLRYVIKSVDDNRIYFYKTGHERSFKLRPGLWYIGSELDTNFGFNNISGDDNKILYSSNSTITGSKSDMVASVISTSNGYKNHTSGCLVFQDGMENTGSGICVFNNGMRNIAVGDSWLDSLDYAYLKITAVNDDETGISNGYRLTLDGDAVDGDDVDFYIGRSVYVTESNRKHYNKAYLCLIVGWTVDDDDNTVIIVTTDNGQELESCEYLLVPDPDLHINTDLKDLDKGFGIDSIFNTGMRNTSMGRFLFTTGDSNNVFGESIITTGFSNKIGSLVDLERVSDSIIIGAGNDIGTNEDSTEISKAVIVGHSNTVSSSRTGMSIFGAYNSSENANSGFVFGMNNITGHEHVIVTGNGLVSHCDNTILAGKFNGEYTSNEIYVVGSGSGPQDRANGLIISSEGDVKAPSCDIEEMDHTTKPDVLVPISYLFSAEFGNALPTTDPGVVGVVWSNAGILTVSAG